MATQKWQFVRKENGKPAVDNHWAAYVIESSQPNVYVLISIHQKWDDIQAIVDGLNALNLKTY